MNKLDAEAKKLNEVIKNNPIYKEFLACQKELENNEELKSLKVKLDEEKKVVCKNKKKTENYDKMFNEYHNNPIVVNYENAKEELEEYLSNITNTISNNLWFINNNRFICFIYSFDMW